MRQIEETYLNSGKVRFGYLHFIIKEQESQWAAEASECAGEQGEAEFWSYHDNLFAVATSDRPLAFSKENLKQFAVELGLDSNAFNQCIDSGKYTSVVETDTQTDSLMNFRSTPRF